MKNNAGLESEIWRSDGVKIDLTDPNPPIIRRDQDFVVKTNDSPIRVNWEAVDDESGIQNYRFGVGDSPDNVNIVPWIDVGEDRSITLNNTMTYINNQGFRISGKFYGLSNEGRAIIQSLSQKEKGRRFFY